MLDSIFSWEEKVYKGVYYGMLLASTCTTKIMKRIK